MCQSWTLSSGGSFSQLAGKIRGTNAFCPSSS